jgi:hypothetical protein
MQAARPCLRSGRTFAAVAPPQGRPQRATMGRALRRDEAPSDDDACTYYRGLPTVRRRGGERPKGSLGRAVTRKLRRSVRKSAPYFAVLLALAFVASGTRYPELLSQVHKVGLAALSPRGGTATQNQRATVEMPPPAKRTAGVDVWALRDEKQRRATRRGAASASQVAPKPEAAAPPPPKRADDQEAAAPPPPDRAAVPEAGAQQPASAPGEAPARAKLKVTDVDMLDAEEGGSEPAITVAGRDMALSEPDRLSLERERAAAAAPAVGAVAPAPEAPATAVSAAAPEAPATAVADAAPEAAPAAVPEAAPAAVPEAAPAAVPEAAAGAVGWATAGAWPDANVEQVEVAAPEAARVEPAAPPPQDSQDVDAARVAAVEAPRTPAESVVALG